MDREEDRVDFSLTVEDVRQLSKTIDYHFEYWPGSAHDPEEQIRLRRLKYLFKAAIMEIQWRLDDGEDFFAAWR